MSKEPRIGCRISVKKQKWDDLWPTSEIFQSLTYPAMVEGMKAQNDPVSCLILQFLIDNPSRCFPWCCRCCAVITQFSKCMISSMVNKNVLNSWLIFEPMCMRNFLNLPQIQKKLSHQWRICQFSVPDQGYITKPAKLLWDWKQTVSPPNQKTFTVSSSLLADMYPY